MCRLGAEVREQYGRICNVLILLKSRCQEFLLDKETIGCPLGLAVMIIEKDVAAGQSTVHHMVGGARVFDAKRSGHGEKM